ncbi:Ubiquinone/menaquinone biosynthesis C-methylase UbiE [Noviherbaspirillum humi]|uniref:Ubiquinone/menaquinone biosynthesis C-methylase UbiE n=1 Tax=Noviherbaspirillum humi TaxID=1688639 RepID=A0A239HSW1_9BURK|nr:class I SAM-dependent methyltransferase [Noviherbaspirillum humi]SNS83933.1 Ubiquinone/menaquinone biosynthesis C-methylase UbiE [Noviherbaspirillum humi]
MSTSGTGNDRPAIDWKGSSAQAWVDTQALLDVMFQPLEERLVQAVPRGAQMQVLDVGCGTGGTTVAAARRLGSAGSCVGIDISRPMIDAAEKRGATEGLPVRFLRDDAQTHAFTPAGFDLIISRFGVMFFEDFTAAFRNLRQAARPGAGLRFIAWRGAEENPFMTMAEQAARPMLPQLPPRRPDEPGQFAFARGERIRDILQSSGWTAIEIEPIDVACTFPESELLAYLGSMGPVGRALQQADENTRQHVIAIVRPRFDRFVNGDTVNFTAACWDVSAEADLLR